MSFAIPSAAAISTYLISYDPDTPSILAATGLVALIPLFSSVFWSFRNVLNYRVMTVGTEPKYIAISQFIDNTLSEKDKYVAIVLNTIENIQYAIDYNSMLNKSRADRAKL